MIGLQVNQRDKVVLFIHNFLGYSIISSFLLANDKMEVTFLVVITAILALLFTRRWELFKANALQSLSWKKNPNKRLRLELKWGVSNGLLFSVVTIVAFWLFSYPDALTFKKIVLLTASCIFWSTGVNFGAELVHLLGKIKKTRRLVEQEKNEVIKVKKEVLQDLISPHFLFNSLNAISLIISEDKTKSIRIVKELSDLYGFILNKTHKTVVLLSEDLDLAKKYSYLLKTRLESGINISFEVPKRYFSCLIPPMTLQNLVENCVKHNVVTKKRVLNIRIFVENDYIVVSNSVNLKMNSGRGSTSLGLNYISSQIGLLDDRKIVVDQNASEFVVKIPLIYKSNLALNESITH